MRGSRLGELEIQLASGPIEQPIREVGAAPRIAEWYKKALTHPLADLLALLGREPRWSLGGCGDGSGEIEQRLGLGDAAWLSASKT